MSFDVLVAGLGPLDGKVERLRWQAMGYFEGAQVSCSLAALPDPQAALGKALQVVDGKGSLLWQGHVSTVRQAWAGGSLRWGTAGLANRVAATYREPAAAHVPLRSAWVEALASQACYGVRESVVNAGVCRAEAALAMAQARLGAQAWPEPRLEKAELAAGRVLLVAEGDLASLNWRWLDLEASVAALVDAGTNTLGLGAVLGKLMSVCGEALAGWQLLPQDERRVPWPGWPAAPGLAQLRRLADLVAAQGERLCCTVDGGKFARFYLAKKGQGLARAAWDGREAPRGAAGEAIGLGGMPLGAYWRIAGQAVWVERVSWQGGKLAVGP